MKGIQLRKIPEVYGMFWARSLEVTDGESGAEPQGQYWAGRTPPNNSSPNMAAANFVVKTNGEGCALNGTAVAAVLINQ